MKSKAIIILSLFVFSLVLWIFVTLSKEYTTQLRVQISVNSNLANVKVSSINPSYLNISIKGKGWQMIKYLGGTSEKFYVEINNAKETNRFDLKNHLRFNPWLTNSVQVISLDPEVITVKSERAFSKKIPILPDLELYFKDGYGLVSEIKVVPDSIMIYGPWSKILLTPVIKTEKLVFNNLEEKISTSAKLINPEFITFSTSGVEISFDVEKIVDRQFDQIEVQTINIPSNKELLLSAEKISLVLKGGIQKLANLKSQELKAVIDYNDAINDSLGYLIPKISLPPNFELIEIKPNKIKYIIKQY